MIYDVYDLTMKNAEKNASWLDLSFLLTTINFYAGEIQIHAAIFLAVDLPLRLVQHI